MHFFAVVMSLVQSPDRKLKGAMIFVTQKILGRLMQAPMHKSN